MFCGGKCGGKTKENSKQLAAAEEYCFQRRNDFIHLAVERKTSEKVTDYAGRSEEASAFGQDAIHPANGLVDLIRFGKADDDRVDFRL